MKKNIKVVVVESMIYLIMLSISLTVYVMWHNEILGAVLVAPFVEEFCRRAAIKYHSGIIYTSVLAASEAIAGFIFISVGAYFFGAILILSRVMHFYLLEINKKSLKKAICIHMTFNIVVLLGNVFFTHTTNSVFLGIFSVWVFKQLMFKRSCAF